MIRFGIDLHLYSMRLINVNAFLERERSIKEGRLDDRQARAKVLEFGDDEVTEYAILSHRWTKQEVDYNEIVKLTKMKEEERSEIRGRDGYRKILQSCEQAKKDRYRWLWVDTCCIDKRSSAELSEAINSMYRWYENSRICYAYLHDLSDSSFPIAKDRARYPTGWPEWFSRGWTLQEMIASRDVQFFNKDWHPIGDKRMLAPTLQTITRVPQHILKEGLSLNRPCVAQIISWAASRTTTRVEDRAYSLMGLLDVNMPMLYGEGKKAFHRLQLEIIRTSNDHSIFAWGSERTGSILADDPSFFRDCEKMELMNRDEFIESLRERIPEEELPWIEDDRLGTFPITNRGIQIWLFLRPSPGVYSDSVFQALLPCRSHPSHPLPVAINVALWESNYYRYTGSRRHEEGRLQLRQVYLRYQDIPHCNSTFEIDDSAITTNFTCIRSIEEMRTPISTDILDSRYYSERSRFAVGFGRWFDQNWIHVVCEEPGTTLWGPHYLMLKSVPEYAQSMKKAHPRAASCRVCIMETPLPRSTWILQISCVMWMWKRSRICGVKLDVFQNPRLGIASGEWTGFDVDVSRFLCTRITIHCLFIQGTDDPNRDWRGLMIRYCPSNQCTYGLLVDGVSIEFSYTPRGIEVSTHTFHSLFESYEDSWGTMVTLRTPGPSATKGTSFLDVLSPIGSTEYLECVETRERTTTLCGHTTTLVVPSHYTNHLACRFRVATTSDHCWLPSPLDSPTDISSQGSYNVPPTLAGLVQARCTALQSHLFGTEMKVLALSRGGREVRRRVTKRELMV